MSIRDAAYAAWVATQQDKTDAARAAMVGLLGDPDGEFSSMLVADVQAPPEFHHTLVVFADDDSDVHLGVQGQGDGSWKVWLVKVGDGGVWTYLGGPLKSLAHLWLLIDEHLPESGEEYPAWVQPTGAHDAYPLTDESGDPVRVTWNGKVWENLVDGNVWEPGVSGWREVAS